MDNATATARIATLEAALRKLEAWFDTDQEILDGMGADERADHDRQLAAIRSALKGA
jgi:hypothetical protein